MFSIYMYVRYRSNTKNIIMQQKDFEVSKSNNQCWSMVLRWNFLIFSWISYSNFKGCKLDKKSIKWHMSLT